MAEIEWFLALTDASIGRPLEQRFNVAPTVQVPIIFQGEAGMETTGTDANRRRLASPIDWSMNGSSGRGGYGVQRIREFHNEPVFCRSAFPERTHPMAIINGTEKDDELTMTRPVERAGTTCSLRPHYPGGAAGNDIFEWTTGNWLV